MPDVCIRHLGLLGLSESIRLSSLSLDPSVITLTLWIVLALAVAQVYTVTLLLSGTRLSTGQRVAPNCPSWANVPTVM